MDLKRQTSAENRTPCGGSTTSGQTRRPWRSSQCAPTTARSPTTESYTTAPCSIRAPAPTTARDDAGLVLDHRAVEQHRALDPRALADRHVPADGRAARDAGRRVDPRALEDQRLARRTGQRGRRCDPADQVRRAAHEVHRGAHVAPVRDVDVAGDPRPRREQPRERLTLDRHRPALRDRLDHLAAEHVAARVDLVRRRVFGLLQERRHPPVRVGGHAAERAGVLHSHEVQGDVGLRPAVRVDDGGEVRAGQHVAVEDQDVARGEVLEDVADAAAGAQRLVLDDVLDLQAERRAVAEVVGEGLGQVGRAEHDPPHARRAGTREQVGEERDAGGRQHRLGGGEGERPQPRALPADEHHGFDVVQHSGSPSRSVLALGRFWVNQDRTDGRSSPRTGRGARSAR